MDWLMSIGKEYGLFVMLVAYVLYDKDLTIKAIKKENAERENKYLAVIQTLSEEVKDRLTKIESYFRRKKDE